MTVVSRRPKAASYAMESELIVRGWRCDDRKKFDEECEKDASQTKYKNPPRFTYSKGIFRILTECHDRPFWTVQKMSGSHVVWFIDFPLDVGVEAVLLFIASA